MTLPLRIAAIEIRNLLTRPFRQQRLRRMCLAGNAPLIVLFYHRVANQHLNDWSMTHQQFANHLDFISQSCEWIDLAEVQQRVRSGKNHRPAVHVTFDDGYAENLEFAIPELVRRNIPCTYFVTLHHILSGEPFDHDRKLGLPIRPNCVEELRQLVRSGIEIGAHTRFHADMGKIHDPDRIAHEITAAANELSEHVNQKIRYFAFPYGMPHNMTPSAIAEVARGGLLGFCSAFGGYNMPGRDAFHIRRVHGDPDLARLKNWLSFDPRKLRREPLITYSLPSHHPV